MIPGKSAPSGGAQNIILSILQILKSCPEIPSRAGHGAQNKILSILQILKSCQIVDARP